MGFFESLGNVLVSTIKAFNKYAEENEGTFRAKHERSKSIKNGVKDEVTRLKKLTGEERLNEEQDRKDRINKSSWNTNNVDIVVDKIVDKAYKNSEIKGRDQFSD